MNDLNKSKELRQLEELLEHSYRSYWPAVKSLARNLVNVAKFEERHGNKLDAALTYHRARLVDPTNEEAIEGNNRLGHPSNQERPKNGIYLVPVPVPPTRELV